MATTMPEDVVQWRKERRRELLARRAAAPAATRREWSEAITRFIVEGFPSLGGMVIGLYWPFKSEFDPRFAIRALREKGAKAALPEVLAMGAPLRFREWWPGAPMKAGAVFDLPVPDGTAIVTPDAVLVPPVGFDSRGYRLGYGGGFFDRTLAAMSPLPLRIGVGFELSRIATIRPQPHDIPMEFIVTEAGIHRVGEAGLELVPAQAA
jgi:5,10-methenyltetrahydrofolate synthetase